MIRVFEPTQNQDAQDAVMKQISAGWISHGDCIEEFEEKFAAYVGAKHCVALNSCSSALELAFAHLASDKDTRPSAFMPRVTFASVWNAASRHCEVELHELVEVNRAYAIHVYSDDSSDLVWDAAHTCRPGLAKGKQYVCYSFYPTKVLSGLEGGALCTDSWAVAEWARVMSRNGLDRKGSEWDYSHKMFGYKMAMTNVQAAYLLAQMEIMDLVNAWRDELYLRYANALPTPRDSDGNYTFVLQCRDREHRDAMIAHLKYRGIETTVQFKPLVGDEHPWSETTLCLPLHMQITNEQQADIVHAVMQLL